jgi:hypothetical protein
MLQKKSYQNYYGFIVQWPYSTIVSWL